MRVGELHLKEYPEQPREQRWGATLKYANGCEMTCWRSVPSVALEALSRAIVDDDVCEYVTAWDAWCAATERAARTTPVSQRMPDEFMAWWAERSGS